MMTQPNVKLLTHIPFSVVLITLTCRYYPFSPVQRIPWWEASPPSTRLTERNMTEQPNSGQSDMPHKLTEDSRGAWRRGGGLWALRGFGGLFLSQIFSTLLSGIFFAS